MSKLITHIKRLALALCLATPFVSRAVTTTGYEDFGDTAGVVLWRGTEANFHASTVIDVAEDGTPGEPYAMKADQSATSWQRFASNQSAYASPGKVLVYDTTGTGDGYKYNPNCTFGPLSFGGMWVKTLAINNLPFSILGSGDRKTEFGAAGKSTLFKFDASYTIDRTGTTTFYGDATVDIADGATFTAQANADYGVAVNSAATLKLKGAGTLAVTTMTVNGTLDLSAETVPTIAGNVTLSTGSTLVVPENTTAIEVCSGTLTVGEIMVKIGDAEPAIAEVTTSEGSITSISVVTETEKTFTSDYPSEVPYGYTYTYEATEAVTIPAVTVNGTLKTSGPITITDLDIANGANFEVVDGNTTVGCSADCKLKGNITVDAGATLTNTRTDSLSYNHSMTVDIYGTLAMGATRWSVPGGCTFKLRNGAQVTGAGDSLASLDFINGASKGLDVYGSATVEGKIRVRANETRIWINGGSTLVLSSGIADGGGHHAGFKQVGPGTLEIHANSTGLSGNASVMTQGTLRLVDTTLAFPVALQGNSSYLEVVATEEATTVPVNVTAIANNNVTFSGAGKVNGSITKTSAPGGNLATALQSAAWTGTFVADWAGNKDTRFDINSYGNANSVVEVTQLAGGYVKDTSAYFYVVPTVNVSGTMTLDNGYSGTVTVFPKLTGSGTVTINTYPVTITMLDKFTGTFNSNANGAIEIGTINLAATPAPGDKIVSIGSSGSFYGLDSTKVAVEGVVDSSFTGNLEKKSDGIYVKSIVTVTVPAVDNTTVTVKVGEDTIGTAAGNYDVASGSIVTVTYAAADGYQISGTTEYTIDTANNETTFTPSAQVAQIVAYIGETPYTDLATAFSAVDDDETLTLVGTAVTLATDVTVAKSYTLAGDAEGTTVTGAGKIYLTGSAALTLDATLTSVGNQFWFSSKNATLTFPTAGFTPSVRPYTDGGCQTGTTVNGDGTSTYYQYLFLTLQVGASNVTLAYDGSGDPVVTKQVFEGDVLVFTAAPAAGYENVVVTVNGETLAPVEGKYTFTVGAVSPVLAATATAMPVITVPSVEHATATATIGGEPVALDANGQATVPGGSVVTVTYMADDGYTFGNGQTEYTIDTASATTFVLDESTVAAQYVASITTGELVVKYTSLQAAIAEVAQNKDIVLLADVAEGATVSREVTFNVVPGAYTYGDIVAGGDFILTVTPAQGKTRYSVSAALIAVTINDVRTLYPATMDGYTAAIEAANAGPIGTTLEVLSGDPADYVEYLPMFDLENDVFTKVTDPVAAVYQGVIQQKVYRTLADAIEEATAGQTVKLLADDSVSFAGVQVTDGVPSNGSIVIDKNITIDGAGFKVYGNTNAEILNATGSATPGYDMVADLVDGTNLMGFFVKSGNVTFTNITLTEFGDTAYVNKFGYTPIQTASAYTGTLTLNGVNFSKFNRTAVCVRGGTLSMTGGTVTANATHKNPDDHCQQPIEVRGGTATISGVAVVSDFEYANPYGAIVAWAPTTVNNVDIDFTGYGIWSDGPAVTVTGEDNSVKATVYAIFAEEGGVITVSAGDFTGALAVDSASSGISLTGGTFDSDVNAFCANGYAATEDNGVWTVDVVQEVPMTPGARTEPVDTQEAAEADAAKVVPSVPAAVAEKLTDEQKADYTEMFEAKVVQVTVGETTKYAVEVVMKESVAEALQTVVDGEAEDLADAVAEAAAKVAGGTAEITTTPGLYYVVEAGTEVGGIAPASCTLATGNTLDLTLPNKGEKGFYKLRVSVTPVAVPSND